MSDFAELFSRDPRNYAAKDLDEIIKYFRNARHQFNAGNMKAGSTKPKTEKQKETLSIVNELKLDL